MSHDTMLNCSMRPWRSGRPRGSHELIIAAIARARRRTVLTRDTAGFVDLPGVDVHIV